MPTPVEGHESALGPPAPAPVHRRGPARGRRPAARGERSRRGRDGASSAPQKLHTALTELPKSGKATVSATVIAELTKDGDTKTDRFVSTSTGSFVEPTSNDPFALGENDYTTRHTEDGKTAVTSGISVDERGYLRAAGRWYELSKGQARRVFNDEDTGRHSGSLKEADLDIEAWTQAPKLAGTATVDGVEVERITGTLNVDAMLATFDNATDGDDSIQTTFANAQKQGEVELLVGKDDGILRKGTVRSQLQLQGPGGTARMALNFDVAIREPGKPQKITAPANAAPVGAISIGFATTGDVRGIDIHSGYYTGIYIKYIQVIFSI